MHRVESAAAVSGVTSPAPTWCGTAMARFTCWRTICAVRPGVSYVLENRQIMKSLFPRLFASSRIRPVSNYPFKLRDMLESSGAGARHRIRGWCC